MNFFATFAGSVQDILYVGLGVSVNSSEPIIRVTVHPNPATDYRETVSQIPDTEKNRGADRSAPRKLGTKAKITSRSVATIRHCIVGNCPGHTLVAGHYLI